MTAAVPEKSIYDRTFWLAYVANILAVMANAMTFRFAELVRALGGTEQTTGDIVSLALAVAVVVRLSVSHLIDEYGTRRMWRICTLLFIAGCLQFLVCGHLGWQIYVARICYMVGLTGMFACSMTHIQNHAPPLRRTEVIGNLGSSGFIGMIFGSNLGDWLYRTWPRGDGEFLALFGGAATLGMVYLAIISYLTRSAAFTGTPSRPAWKLLFVHWPGVVILAAMVMGLGQTVITVFLTRFATTNAIESLGPFFTGYAVSAFIFRISIQSWPRTIGRNWMLVRGLLGHTLGHALIPFCTDEWQLMGVAVICGFGHSLLFPAVVSLGSGAFPKESRGSGTAIILGVTDLGGLVFSPLLGRTIVLFGFPSMFWLSAGMALSVALLYVVIAFRRPDNGT